MNSSAESSIIRRTNAMKLEPIKFRKLCTFIARNSLKISRIRSQTINAIIIFPPGSFCYTIKSSAAGSKISASARVAAQARSNSFDIINYSQRYQLHTFLSSVLTTPAAAAAAALRLASREIRDVNSLRVQAEGG